MVNALVSRNGRASATVTKSSTPSNANAEPVKPLVNVASYIKEPAWFPVASRPSPSPRHQATSPSGGTVHWVVGNLGDIPTVTLGYQMYQAQGWTIDADPSGTRFTNNSTGHGMFVAVEGVQTF